MGKIHPYRQITGFTLTELLLVIAIISIMLGAIVPNFSSFMRGSALKYSSQSIIDILRFARSTAIERSANTKVEFNTTDYQIIFSVESDPLESPGTFIEENLPVKPPKEFGDLVTITKIEKRSLTGSLEDTLITFAPDGTTSDTFIFLKDQAERTYTIGIVGLTGQVLVWDHLVQSFYDE